MGTMTEFGTDLIKAMSETLAHVLGKGVPGVRVHTMDIGTVDAKAKMLDLTQDKYARLSRRRTR